MIETICARLEERKDRWTDLANQSNFDGYAQEEKEYLLMANEDEKLIEIVQEVAKDGGWIPVEENTPMYSGYYLTTEENCKRPRVNYFTGIKWCTDETCLHSVCVIAWQPLPAPYQKGE